MLYETEGLERKALGLSGRVFPSPLNFLLVVLRIELWLFVFGIIVCVAKGLLWGLWDGHGFLASLNSGLLPLVIPTGILVIYFIFICLMPEVLRLILTIPILTYMLHFVFFFGIPESGHFSGNEQKIGIVESSRSAAIETRDLYNKAIDNPNGPEAEIVARWKSYNPGKTYESYIVELEQKANKEAEQAKKIEESHGLFFRFLFRD